ncbi:MAG: tyrosine--tRNA ligase, partial [Candidatus Thermoplasmatota archaeon]|nr:tyrosine--tRNA ligase [Candidatus Thermoplasmatota archaeon]
TFPKLGRLRIDRPVKYGGPVEYHTIDEVIRAYTSGSLHPQDLKKGASDSISEVLAPVREHFEANPKNLEKVRALSVTR